MAALQRHSRAEGLAEGPVALQLLAAARATPAPPQVLQMLYDLSCTTPVDGVAAAAVDSGSDRERSPITTAASMGPSKRVSGGGGVTAAAAAATSEGVCIRVLCRSREQVDAAVQVPWLKEVVVDFLEVQGLKEAVAAVSR